MSSAVRASLTRERREQIEEMFRRIDTMDPACLDPYLAPEAKVVFGNQPPLVGSDDVKAGCEQFFAAIAGIHHEIVGLWEFDRVTVVKLQVTYTRHDGGVVTVPVITLIERADTDLIENYLVYFDLAPVFA
jgi:SnoaL-like domain